MTIKAILFDIDGTLIDSNDLHVAAWDEAFRELGAKLDRQVIHDQIGKGTDMLVPTLLPHLEKAGQAALGDRHGEIFKAKYLARAKAFAKAHELLAYASAHGQTVVLASSASEAELNHYLDVLDARSLVQHSVTSDDVERTKPAPDIFSVALRKLDGLEATQVMVVGDTPYDIEAAKKAGMKAIGLRSGGFDDRALTSAGAVALYDDVSCLLQSYDESPLG